MTGKSEVKCNNGNVFFFSKWKHLLQFALVMSLLEYHFYFWFSYLKRDFEKIGEDQEKSQK